MQTIKNTWRIVAVFVLAAGTLAGCKDDEVSRSISRLFMPGDLSTTVKYNTINVGWGESRGAAEYLVDISTEEDFSSLVESRTVEKESLETLFTGLDELTTYYLRVMAVNSDPGKNSKYNYGSARTQALRSIFDAPQYEDIGFEFVSLRWQEENLTADRIVFTTGGQDVVTHTLTVGELENQAARPTGLTPGTTYRAYMQNGTDRVSYIDFSTPERPAGAIETDNTQSLKDVIEGAAEGATILIAGGQTYYHSTEEINLRRSVTLQGMPGYPKPLLYVKQFNVSGALSDPGVTIGSIGLVGLEISGYALDTSQGQPALMNEPGAVMLYFTLVNQTKTVNLTKLTIDNCILRNYHTTCIGVREYNLGANARLRVGEINVNNTIAFDLGRKTGGFTSFITLSSGGTGDLSCDKYVIKNSTFHHLNNGIIEARKTGIQEPFNLPTAEVTNCTFDFLGVNYGVVYLGTNNGQRYMFDFTNNAPYMTNVTVNLTDCVFGQVVTGAPYLRPAAFNGAAGVFVNTHYAGTDFKITSGFTSATNTGGSAEALFPNRANEDFTINPQFEIPTIVGDPRWRTE